MWGGEWGANDDFMYFMLHMNSIMDGKKRSAIGIRQLHEATKTEARRITGRVGGTAGYVTQSERFADTGTAAARVASAAADGV